MAIATIPRVFAEALAGSFSDVVTDATNAVRDGVARSVRLRLSEDPAGPKVEAHGDHGWFGPDSVAWRVHADLSTVTGGLRALLYQTLHPLAMAGVADHSDYRSDPWSRLRRTAQFVAATTYGTSAEAEAAVAVVKRVHRHVRGTSPDGRSYSADRPDLLAWVHATEVDSFLAAYRRYGPGLDDADADRYVDEMAVVARAFGADPVPTSAAELQSVLASYSLHATRQTREAMRFLLAPPLPLTARPTYGLIATAAIELLPWSAQRELRLMVPPIAGPLGVRPATRALLGTLRWALGTSPALAAAHARTSRPGSMGPVNQ